MENDDEMQGYLQKTMQMLDNGKMFYMNSLTSQTMSDLHHALLYIKASCSEITKYGLQNQSAAYWCSLVYSRMSFSFYSRGQFDRANGHADNGLNLLEKLAFDQVDASDIHPDDTPNLLRIRLYYCKGASLLQLQRFEESELYLRKGLELAPNHCGLIAAFHTVQAELDRFKRKRSIDRNNREDYEHEEEEMKRKVPHQM